MTSRRGGETRTVGRAQAGRPQATPEAHKHVEGERGLVGALSVPIEQISPDPDQPRKEFDQGRLRELAESIAAQGVLQPLVVRETGLLDDGRTHYTIVVGGRRYEASRLAGLTRLPVIVRNSEGASLRVIQLMENIQREALNPIDEAQAFKELMGLEGIDTRAVAERIHRSHTYVADRVKLIAHEDVAAAVARRELTPSAASEVARERDAAMRQELIQRARGGTLQKRDVQRLRREARLPAGPQGGVGGEPTLREVAQEFGASEEQVKAAAEARRDAPDLSPAEALALAMVSAGEELPLSSGAVALHAPLEGANRVNEAGPLHHLVEAAGGADVVLRVLLWAVAQGLSLEELTVRVRHMRGDEI